MDYVMYIQNGESLGHAEFEDYEKAYEAMKIMTARHIGVATDMLGSMMNTQTATARSCAFFRLFCLLSMVSTSAIGSISFIRRPQ